jgi:hypothetical protein
MKREKVKTGGKKKEKTEREKLTNLWGKMPEMS